MIKLIDILKEITESTSDEAWELVGQKDPNISKIVKDAGYKYDEESVSKLTPIIEKTPITSISPSQMLKLKNFNNKPGEESLINDIINISKSKNPKQGYIDLMTKRDKKDSNRQRGYDIGNLYDQVVKGNYESPVLIEIKGVLYVIGGRTRLYAGLASNKNINVKIIKISQLKEITEGDPKVGTGKKPKGSGRRLYTDEDPKDTVSIKFKTVQDIKDTLSKSSFQSKPHKRQSQIINLIHQRVRAAYGKAKDPEVKARLKKGLEYITAKKEASKKKTERLNKLKELKDVNEKNGFGGQSRYRAIEKRGDKYYYIQDNPFAPGIRQEFGPYKTKEQAKKKMGTFPPSQNYRDLTQETSDPQSGKSAPYGSGYAPFKQMKND